MPIVRQKICLSPSPRWCRVDHIYHRSPTPSLFGYVWVHWFPPWRRTIPGCFSTDNPVWYACYATSTTSIGRISLSLNYMKVRSIIWMFMYIYINLIGSELLNWSAFVFDLLHHLDTPLPELHPLSSVMVDDLLRLMDMCHVNTIFSFQSLPLPLKELLNNLRLMTGMEVDVTLRTTESR